MTKRKILITGGSGFIGSNLVRVLVKSEGCSVINLDKLTYAGNSESLEDLADDSNYIFDQIDLCNVQALRASFIQHQPDVVIHLAAESHVDRSIDEPGEFIQTNIIGTYNLLQVALQYWKSLEQVTQSRKESFRFLHVSTDEVYGALETEVSRFSEATAYDPRSPYSASKAAADHLVRAWGNTYGLPVLVTNCSNNYGPYQFPEKLIPLVILKCISNESIPVYGTGRNIRDWLYVEDHADALYTVLLKGRVGETYNIGANHEMRNIELVRSICRLMDELQPCLVSDTYESLITFVEDRPGHDIRYAIDASKIRNELGWAAKESFESGLRKTVLWYLENQEWWQCALGDSYAFEKK